MRFHSCVALALLTFAQVAPAAQQEKPAENKTAARTLTVKLNYSGAGTVDSKHHIIVFLFDSPDFATGGVMPFASMHASAKDETVVFSDLAQPSVYIAAIYDPSGDYDGQSGPPPTGSSVGMYSKSPGAPEAVKLEPGETAQVELGFDDSVKVP
jgi:hypothetical protein